MPQVKIFQALSESTGMYVEHIRGLYAWTYGMLKAELKSRNVNSRDNDTDAALVEPMIADMLRNKVAAAIGEHPSGKLSMDYSTSSGNMSVDSRDPLIVNKDKQSFHSWSYSFNRNVCC